MITNNIHWQIFLFTGHPENNTSATADPYKTLFVARIVNDTTFIIKANLVYNFIVLELWHVWIEAS